MANNRAGIRCFAGAKTRKFLIALPISRRKFQWTTLAALLSSETDPAGDLMSVTLQTGMIDIERPCGDPFALIHTGSPIR